MIDENATSESQADGKSRRDFVRSSAAVAVTAPAVALLLSASTKPAVAQQVYNGTPPLNKFFDDFTFGNNAEDIDAVKSGTDLTTLGKPAQDDHNTV